MFKKYFKKTIKDEVSELNIDIQNPVIKNLSSNHQVIKEYLRLNHLSFNDLLNWSCPICLETLESPNLCICIPFKCSHPICFSCLKSWCTSFKKRRDVSGLYNISCCLCRKQSSDFWYNSLKIYILTTTYQQTKISVVFPSQLDHRYPLRRL